MFGLSWEEFLIIALLVLCVLGPILVVLLTQNFLSSAGRDEAAQSAGGFLTEKLPDAQPRPAIAARNGKQAHADRRDA